MTAQAQDVLVSARQLTRRFGSFVAVRNVDVDIPRGRVFGFLGPNGSGKSTTIRMLAGLLAPSSGTITGFGGIQLATNTDAWKRRLGYMSQKFSLYLDLTVEENLRFFGSVYGLRGASLLDRIDALADRLRFQEVRRVLTEGLSTGLRQRVALAAALLHEPELLFLDEPTGGVDPVGRRMFWDLIYELAADRGMTVLVTTHYMDEAEQCDRLAFILDGELIADGSPLDLKSHLAGRLFEVVVEHDAFGALETLRSQQQFEDVYLAGRHLRAVLRAEARDAALAPLAAIGRPESAEPSLEDVFVSLARKRSTSSGEAA
ncbi:putative ABC transporter ATP-binding protein YbhF [Luteitalea pratensis]|uniref:Putative ABC transporter ATP-binding protein YbhF n=1 Tax=Luteitalea pratensis TaxID=1855912 RepID=A0A143PPA9_LUTPR|nr:ABC transporter ATP-binding protein [Luteitalea pratensis]AMY09649.1 putative ABC transporter ATP-binding protein YbhF [Luteitalea pratensis]